MPRDTVDDGGPEETLDAVLRSQAVRRSTLEVPIPGPEADHEKERLLRELDAQADSEPDFDITVDGQVVQERAAFEDEDGEFDDEPRERAVTQVFHSPFYEPSTSQAIMVPSHGATDVDETSDGHGWPQASLEPEAADPYLQLPEPSLLHVIPVDRVDPVAEVVMINQPGSRAAEQYRVLAQKIREFPHVRVTLLAWPDAKVEGELAGLNLSLALAEGNRTRVCLLDANLRKSRVCQLLGLEGATFLGDQIREHRMTPDEPWQVLGLGPAMHILPARPVETNPVELLHSQELRDLMAILVQRFDYVVITAPPVLETADAVVLKDISDGILVVAMTHLTRQDAMRTTLVRLGEGKLIGSVLLHSRSR